jgi:hypothetical protein
VLVGELDAAVDQVRYSAGGEGGGDDVLGVLELEAGGHGLHGVYEDAGAACAGGGEGGEGVIGAGEEGCAGGLEGEGGGGGGVADEGVDVDGGGLGEEGAGGGAALGAGCAGYEECWRWHGCGRAWAGIYDGFERPQQDIS